MIRHIVFFSVKDPRDIDTVVAVLRGYREIPGVHALEVARNAKRDAISGEIDVVLHALFESVEALEAYKRHPLYQEGITKVRPLRELRFVVDYAVEGTATETDRSETAGASSV